jgi:hypothetical protein
MARELSRHANVILYSGAFYEELLWKSFRVKGESLNERIRNASHLIPRDLANQMRQFSTIRNACAHECDYVILDKLSDAINLINEIEKGLATSVKDYKPSFVSENDFQQATPTGRRAYVQVPKPRNVYFQEVVVPRLVKTGVAAAVVVISCGVVVIVASGGRSHSSSGYTYSPGYTYGTSGTPNHGDGAVVLLALIAMGVLILIVGWITHALLKKWRAKHHMARIRRSQ